MNVTITKVNISSPEGCMVKKEKCKNEAYWWINNRFSICDKHLKEFCKATKIDYKSILKESKEKMEGKNR